MKKSNIKHHIEFDLEFRRNPHKGLYIAFEGIDGAGKTVQVKLLEEYLKSKGREVVTTAEPRREGPVGALIHKILQGKVKVPSVSLQFLYTAERVINHSHVVEPALEARKIVLSHRCLWSNLPYGMLDKHMADYGSNDSKVIDVAHGLMSLYHQFIVPDITFYLRVPAEIAAKRLEEMHTGHELYEKKDKMEKVARGYEWQVKQFPEEFVIIDGDKSEEEVARQVRLVIDQKLNE